LYPELGARKIDVANYYAQVADWILPHLAERPLSLLRCPEGRQGDCFFQKHAMAGLPDVVGRVQIQEKGKTASHLVVKNLAGLIVLVQFGVLEFHLWGSRADDIERPDRLVFDLDPGEDVAWKEMIAAARAMRGALADLGLESFVKTTGGKGLHVVAPIRRHDTWDEVKPFCRAVAQRFAAEAPERYTTNMSKAARPGKIFIDYLRNDRGATAIAPY
jgi:bifunctional non-homologous end joining protein LigD